MEEQLWISETRGNRAWMNAILSPTFTEFGSGGRVYDRSATRTRFELSLRRYSCNEVDDYLRLLAEELS